MIKLIQRKEDLFCLYFFIKDYYQQKLGQEFKKFKIKFMEECCLLGCFVGRFNLESIFIESSISCLGDLYVYNVWCFVYKLIMNIDFYRNVQF